MIPFHVVVFGDDEPNNSFIKKGLENIKALCVSEERFIL